MRKYVNLRFLDSFAFLSCSLSKLVKNLNGNLPILESIYSNEPLLKQKGVFPYEWWDNISKMKYTTLPNIEDFYSRLNGCGIKEDDYKRAKEVWEHFNIKDMSEYHDLYLLTDTLQLADVFESFRELSLKTYGLDPVYYYSTPNYAWDVMLRNTRKINNESHNSRFSPVNEWCFNNKLKGKPLKLELLTDPDMFLMFEQSIRGGISQVGQKRYSKSNDETKLMYLDANNLYGWAMSKLLPISNFKQINDAKIKKLEKKLQSGERLDSEGKYGLLLLVDFKLVITIK